MVEDIIDDEKISFVPPVAGNAVTVAVRIRPLNEKEIRERPCIEMGKLPNQLEIHDLSHGSGIKPRIFTYDFVHNSADKSSSKFASQGMFIV